MHASPALAAWDSQEVSEPQQAAMGLRSHQTWG